MKRWLAILAVIGSPLLAGDPPNAATVVFNGRCDDVARVAVPLLQKRGWLEKKVAPPWPRCTEATLCLDLASDKLHTAGHGFLIFNALGRYSAGGGWRSFFAGPGAKGGAGQFRLTQQAAGKCAAALEFRFSTVLVSGEIYGGHYDSEGHYQDDGVVGKSIDPGPWLTSNGRLEREYMDAIRKAFEKRGP